MGAVWDERGYKEKIEKMNASERERGEMNMTYVLNVFIDIQTSKQLIQMDTDKMMTYMEHLQWMMKNSHSHN